MSVIKEISFRCNGVEEGASVDLCHVTTVPILSDTTDYAWRSAGPGAGWHKRFVASGAGWHKRFVASGGRTLPGTKHYCPECWAYIQSHLARQRQASGR